MAARRPFCKWHCWKSIGFCLWPPSTCIWNLKLKFQSKLDLCSGNHVVYRQTDGRTDRRTDGQGESNFVGRGYKNNQCHLQSILMLLLYFWSGLAFYFTTLHVKYHFPLNSTPTDPHRTSANVIPQQASLQLHQICSSPHSSWTRDTDILQARLHR